MPPTVRKVWPLPKLLERNRNAGTVFGAILHLAGERRRLGVTRARIRAVCGLCERKIGRAVAALAEAGWLKRTYSSDIRDGRKSWYRILLPKCTAHLWYQNGTTGKRDSGPKRYHRKSVSCGIETVPHTHKGIRAVPTDALMPTGRASAPAHAGAPGYEDSGPTRSIVEVLGLKS